MRSVFFVLGFIFIFSIAPFSSCFSYTFSVYEPPMAVENGTPSYPKITKLESIILKQTYENESIEKRLQRLEEKACKKVYSDADLAWRVDNIVSKIDQSELYNISSKELASIEKKILGKTFKRDDLNSRLSRLEFKMLGAVQSGKINDRYETILSASNHYIDFGNNIENTLTNSYYPSNGIKNTFKNIFSTIAGSGSVTGYTPPISPYGFNTPYGFNPSYGTYGPRNFFNGQRRPYSRPNIGFRPRRYYNTQPQQTTRYYDFNNNYSSGLGVHILD